MNKTGEYFICMLYTITSEPRHILS